ncbi:MAG: carboxylating nicotinate-nucleotide diphosphorylase [Bacteroidetes bacterium]|nr:MAG: carboxylating nicotinate-nucleotide diphosphorylase [Bacteroidota bacterium]
MVEEFIKLALEEDIREGDHSTLACIPSDALGSARLLVKENGIIAGIDLAEKIFKYVEPQAEIIKHITDGTQVAEGDEAFTVKAKVHTILKTERLVLNCMQRMSGIATKTARYVKLVEGTKAKILDTRKTTPLLRFLEKQAVKIGGGENHRFGLYDMIMLKDNHIDYAGGIKQAVSKTKEYLKKNQLNLKIEVEARNLNEVEEIIEVGGIDRIMLDNFSVEDTRKAVELINGRYETESSGGITEKTVREYALCGVDYISVGALTHSVKSLDLSLKAI